MPIPFPVIAWIATWWGRFPVYRLVVLIHAVMLVTDRCQFLEYFHSGSFASLESGGVKDLDKYGNYVYIEWSERAYFLDLLLLNTCQNWLKGAFILIWMCHCAPGTGPKVAYFSRDSVSKPVAEGETVQKTENERATSQRSRHSVCLQDRVHHRGCALS